MRTKSLICLVFSLLLAPAFSLALEIITPQPDSVVGDSKVVVIGLAPKADKGKVSVGDKTIPFAIKDGSFSVVIDLKPGKQEVSFNVGAETARIKWTVDPAAKKTGFRYHPGVTNDKCDNCHKPGAKLDKDEPMAETCYRCHKPMDTKTVVHGPVAMGLCAACHDPHGSSVDNSLRTPILTLCQDCHNQPVSEAHRKASTDTLCIKCHDPHGSSKPYMIK